MKLLHYFRGLVIYCLLTGSAVAQLQSPPINLSVESAGINLIRWTNDPNLRYETYNIYAGFFPITEQNKNSAIKIASLIPGGIEAWHHHPFSHDGLRGAYYYAMTIVQVGGSETPIIDGVSNGGPVINSTSPTMKALYRPNFADAFMPDGNLQEFKTQPFSKYTIVSEKITGDESQTANWNNHSLDISYQVIFVIDDNYL